MFVFVSRVGPWINSMGICRRGAFRMHERMVSFVFCNSTLIFFFNVDDSIVCIRSLAIHKSCRAALCWPRLFFAEAIYHNCEDDHVSKQRFIQFWTFPNVHDRLCSLTSPHQRFYMLWIISKGVVAIFFSSTIILRAISLALLA